jgi:hypothetical protein
MFDFTDDRSPALTGGDGARRPKIADAILLADLIRVAKLLNQTALSQSDYSEHGRYSFITICRRFGSWKAALLLVRLEPASFMNISAEILLADISRVAGALKTDCLRYSEYLAHGKYSRKIIYRLFGRWQTAAEAAKLTPIISRPTSRAELVDHLKDLWQRLGRQPKYEETTPPLSKFGAATYAYRFGTFKKAIFAAQREMDPELMGPWPAEVDRSVRGFERRGPRTINARLRFVILRRDRFRCCACGRSPATHVGVQLAVDHIVPWSAGGETVEANLQTLCQKCGGENPAQH